MSKTVKNNEVEVVTNDQVVEVTETVVTSPTYEELLGTYKTKSGVIRYLHSQGWKNGPISKFMGIRYQHVRNVLITPLSNKG